MKAEAFQFSNETVTAIAGAIDASEQLKNEYSSVASTHVVYDEEGNKIVFDGVTHPTDSGTPSTARVTAYNYKGTGDNYSAGTFTYAPEFSEGPIVDEVFRPVTPSLAVTTQPAGVPSHEWTGRPSIEADVMTREIFEHATKYMVAAASRS